VHDCLAKSGASLNIMPYSVCLQINLQPQKSAIQIVQLDRTRVKVLGELKDVLIRLSSNSKVFQIIDVIVVDITDAHGLILSRYWSKKLHGYFSTDWSLLWLPYNGKPNQIHVNRVKHMKHNVTYLDGENEPVSFANNIVENYSIDYYFGKHFLNYFYHFLI
jgi:hypothetical protein